MKDPEIKIVRKMSEEQKKLMFFAPAGIIVLVICGYVLFNDKDKASNSSLTNNKTEWELPKDSHKELPNSSLEITDQLNKHNDRLNKNNFRSVVTNI